MAMCINCGQSSCGGVCHLPSAQEMIFAGNISNRQGYCSKHGHYLYTKERGYVCPGCTLNQREVEEAIAENRSRQKREHQMALKEIAWNQMFQLTLATALAGVRQTYEHQMAEVKQHYERKLAAERKRNDRKHRRSRKSE